MGQTGTGAKSGQRESLSKPSGQDTHRGKTRFHSFNSMENMRMYKNKHVTRTITKQNL